MNERCLACDKVINGDTDPCLIGLLGVREAHCGRGVNEPTVITDTGHAFRGSFAMDWIRHKGFGPPIPVTPSTWILSVGVEYNAERVMEMWDTIDKAMGDDCLDELGHGTFLSEPPQSDADYEFESEGSALKALDRVEIALTLNGFRFLGGDVREYVHE